MKTKSLMGIGLLVVSLLGCTAKGEPKTWLFDFNQDYHGFDAIYADYHDDGNNYSTYEMVFDRTVIPGTTNPGLRLQGHNRSDDLFMGIVKALDGLKPSTTYSVTVSFTLYTEAEAGTIGIGGSPADSVYVKAGVVNTQPQVSEDGDGLWVLNIDKGQQSVGGATIPVVGTMAKPEGAEAGFVSKGFEVTITIKTNALGQLWLIIGSDSGFEGLTIYYLDDISLNATPK